MNRGNTKKSNQTISRAIEHKRHKFVKHSISIEERENYYSQKLPRKITRYLCICGEIQEIAREPFDTNLIFDVFYSEAINGSPNINK